MDNTEKFPGTKMPQKPNTHIDCVIKGKDNIVSDSATNVIVFGANNVIGAGAKNISIFNSSGCVVLPGVQGVVIHNSSGVIAAFDDQSFNHGSVSAGKIYKAFLTQSGTDAPTATEYENSINDLTFSYLGVGLYRLTSASSAFKTNKTFVYPKSGYSPSFSQDYFVFITLLSESQISITTTTSSGSFSDDRLFSEIIIEIYP